MDVLQFRRNIVQDALVIIDDQKYHIYGLVQFDLDGGGQYIKLFLSDGSVLADDLESNGYVHVRPFTNTLSFPSPKIIEHDGHEYSFLFDAHAAARDVKGRSEFILGDGESFADYASKDGKYMSLGVVDKTGERMDFIGKEIDPKNINIE